MNEGNTLDPDEIQIEAIKICYLDYIIIILNFEQISVQMY